MKNIHNVTILLPTWKKFIDTIIMFCDITNVSCLISKNKIQIDNAVIERKRGTIIITNAKPLPILKLLSFYQSSKIALQFNGETVGDDYINIAIAIGKPDILS